MERKAEEKTVELGNRIEKHESETEEQFRITGEEISKTNKEVAQVKDRLGKLSLGTPEGGEQEKGEFKKVMEGKMEDMERRLVKCVETQCEKQGVLLREQGGGYAPSRRIVPRWGRCHRAE